MAVNGFLVNDEVQKYNYESLENYNTPDFSTSLTYQVGDYVMYQGKLYRCTDEIATSGGWDSSKWILAILSDDVANLRSSVESGEYGLSEPVKQAILQIARKVAYIDDQGQTYYDDLYNALYPFNVVSITAVYTQSGTVYDTDTLDSLKADLVVTAHYSDSSTQSVPANAYTLSGTLTAGTSTITVSYSGKTTTFSVTVTSYMSLLSFFKGANVNVYSGHNVVSFGNSGTPQAIGPTPKRAFAYFTASVNGGTRITTPSDYYPVPDFPSNAYPIAIPNGATKLTISCTGLMVATTIVKENGDGTEVRMSNTLGWSELGGFTNFDLTEALSQGATHIMPGFKNSTDTTLENTTIDSTTVQIIFS